MPCRTDYDDEVRISSALKSMLEASLCALSRFLENSDGSNWYENVDWKGAGVSQKEFLVWLENHKEVDKRRREIEAKHRLEEKKKADALSKLTYEERKLLGLSK